MSKSQRASIISKPLFINVAESTVIRGPIFQVGCSRASSGVTSASSDMGRFKNGPPEAVRIRRRTSRLWPARRHWSIALCSLSTGRIIPPCLFAVSRKSWPAITIASLFASATGFPEARAAYVGSKPAAPTAAETTTSTSSSAASEHSPAAPSRT